MSLLKILLVTACIIVFATTSHLALVAQDVYSIWRQIAAFMLTVPVFAIAGWSCMNFLARVGVTKPVRLLCAILMFLLVIYIDLVLRPVMLSHLDYMYLAEHVSTNMMLCWLFAYTLLSNRTPLVTTLASATHSYLPEKILRYTRHVTQAWAIFFLLQVLMSLAIFYMASIETWSWFANVLNWPLIVLMFVAEYICRKRMNPDFPHSTIQQSVAAYFNNQRKT